MYETARSLFANCDVFISAAAVSDFRAEKRFSGKMKRSMTDDVWSLPLVHNPDILGSLSEEKKHQVMVGFAAESSEILANAKKKLEDKGLDMIVANDISRADTGFAADTNSVWLLGRDFEVEIGLESKEAIAHKIVDKIVEKLLVRK